MRRSWRLWPISSIGLLLTIAFLLSGCPKFAGLSGEEEVKPATLIQEPPAAGAPSAKESPLKDIFFDFDKSTIRDDAKPNLNEDLQWLNANPAEQITIEGHCDERGTSEYNLGLGERRARAARDYLAAAGIKAKRIKIVSFGKERPFVMGHDEAAWKWNRRSHFVVGER